MDSFFSLFYIFIGLGLGAVIGFFVAKKIVSLQAIQKQSSLHEKINLLEQKKINIEQNSKTEINRLENLINNQKNERLLIIEESKTNLESLRFQKDEAIQLVREEKNNLAIALERANANKEELEEKLLKNKGEIEKLQEKFTKEFENLANKILEEKSQKFVVQNKENLSQILNPLQEKILHFEKKVEETNKESIDRNAALRQQISGLKELNQQMSKETVNLTKALKGDSKAQGNWGELVLERVLEKSGLQKGITYELEKSFATNQVEGKTRLRPDAIIHLPDNRKMIVDAKVSLTAYERYTQDIDGAKEMALKDHIASINKHVDQLSHKKYEDLYQMESPDFVLLFIPIEPAFAVALEKDGELYNRAFSKNIVIVTPTTLLATLKTIESIWRNENQQRNALEIARQAGALYDKFAGLLKDLISIGKKMNDTKKDYEAAMNKLTDGTGNLISRVEKIKTLGAKAKKALPEALIQRASEE